MSAGTLHAAMMTLRSVTPMRIGGVVAGVRGMSVYVDQLPVPVGSLVRVESEAHRRAASSNEIDQLGEVVGFQGGQTVVMLLNQTAGIRAGDRVWCEETSQTGMVGASLLGRCIDGLGRALDGQGRIGDTEPRSLIPEPLKAMRRRRISRALHTGVRAIDLMTTLGRGQRIGVFAGPGVGKSTLLGTIARRSDAEVNVIALIGERGREVKDFLTHSLGDEGLAKSVVVVATGDESPLMRIRAARLACTCAEYFRDQGRDVMLMMDSVTRFAHAQRQVGLSVGEPPATKGYTPSVFASLALLLERAGAVEAAEASFQDPRGRNGEPSKNQSDRAAKACSNSSAPAGSITGLYTILVEGDDLTEPISDAARGILDGHIVLSRRLAQKGHYPAVDVLDSVSRVADEVCDAEHLAARRTVVRLLATYREVEDLVQIGAYAKGSNPEADCAIEMRGRINQLLQQDRNEVSSFHGSRASLIALANAAGDFIRKTLPKP